MLISDDETTTNLKYYWCISHIDKFWTPHTYVWGFLWDNTQDNIKKVLKKLKTSTKLIEFRKIDDQIKKLCTVNYYNAPSDKLTHVALFKGKYKNYAHFLIELSFIRCYVQEQNEDTECQKAIRKLLDKNCFDMGTIIKHVNKSHKYYGHSPIYGLENDYSPITVQEYIQASQQLKKDEYTYGQACTSTFKKAYNLKYSGE